jgi:hypothetical protein
MQQSIYGQQRYGLRLDQCSFYHTMEIPGFGLINGWGWDHRAHVGDMFRGVNFAGKRVLEVGPASGFITQMMDQQGAEVVSIEAPPFHKWDIIPFPGFDERWQPEGDQVWEPNTNAWWFVHEHFKMRAKVCYVGAYDIDTKPLGRFDTAVLFHVLIHARDPLKILRNCAAITDGEIIIGELVDSDVESLPFPVQKLIANPNDKSNFNAWWHFNSRLFADFLAICGFTRCRVERYTLTYKGVPHENFTLVASRQ